jgi:hypothetical protein
MKRIYLLEEFDNSYERTEVVACFKDYPTLKTMCNTNIPVLSNEQLTALITKGELEIESPWITYYITSMRLIE